MGIATHVAEWIRPRVVAAGLVVAGLVAGPVACSPPPPDAAANPFGGAGSDGGAGGPTSVDGGTTETVESSTTAPSTSEPSTSEPSTTAPSSGADTDLGESGTTEPSPQGDSSSTDPAQTGSSGSSSTGGDGGVADTYDDGVVHVLVEIQSMWDAGECDDITVTNISDAPVTWEVDVPLPGVVYQLWNAEMVEMGGVGTFVGVDFNADLDPGESAMFGFCVNY